jgi:hypothetical protein
MRDAGSCGVRYVAEKLACHWRGRAEGSVALKARLSRQKRGRTGVDTPERMKRGLFGIGITSNLCIGLVVYGYCRVPSYFWPASPVPRRLWFA